MKISKKWLIAACSLLLIGILFFGGAMTMLNWNFKKLSTVKYETNDYNIEKEFQNISILTNTADIEFVPTSNGTEVKCFEAKNVKHSVLVTENTLEIKIYDQRKWYEYIALDFNTSKITVEIPAGEYGKLKINNSTGDVKIPDDFKFEEVDIKTSTGTVNTSASALKSVKIKASTGSIKVQNLSASSLSLKASTGNITAEKIKCDEKIDVSVSTGKTSLNNISCKNLIVNGDTGGISLKNVISDGNFNIECDTGDVTFEKCDAGEIFIETDTGDIDGSLLTAKVFITKTDTGSVNVPKTVTGGRCEISTDTGDIKITVLSIDK